MAEELMKPKGAAMPQFFTEAVHLEFQSKQEGRPIYEEREFVRVLIPGDRLTSPVSPVTDEHKRRWAKEYDAFRAGLEAPLEGTPLAQWPPVNTSRVKELAYFNIFTVEQLAAVSDAHLSNLGMGARELRERAKLFLEVARTGTGPLDRLQSENERLTREVERLTRQITETNTELNLLKAQHASRAA